MDTIDRDLPQPRYRFPSFSIGAWALEVNLTKANHLAASLEDEQLIERLTHSPLTSR